MAEARLELRERQPWMVAYEHDGSWFDAVMAAHYAGGTGPPPIMPGLCT